MIILNQMIHAGRFTEFVQEIVQIRNKEVLEQARWEYWLHRCFDMSFKEYVAKIEGTDEEIPSDDAVEETIRDSMGMINGFCPS